MRSKGAPPLIWIARPKGRAAQLTEYLVQLGYKTQHLPTLEITLRPENIASQRQLLKNMRLAIFVSQAAVEAFGLALKADKTISISTATQWFAVGEETAKQLEANLTDKMGRVVYPQEEKSEGLLNMAALQQVAGLSTVIFQGNAGRTLLAEGLLARGAEVNSLLCYEAFLPEASALAWEKHWKNPPSAIVTTSNQVLKNLIQLTPPQHRKALLSTPLVVVSARGKTLALEKGFKPATILEAAGAKTEAVAAALKGFFLKN